MKAFIMALSLVSMINILAAAQDRIIMKNGDTLSVTIMKTTPELVEFNYPNETIVATEYKNAMHKIIYASGREEVCSEKSLLQEVNGPDDWEKVVITYTESDVKGLTKVGQITKTSGWGGTMATGLGYKDALKKIKKEAAKQFGKYSVDYRQA